MTREEVIERLRLILETDIMTLNGFNIPHEPLEKEIEALKIAIKVLEQEPILDKIKEDFIARYPRNYAGELELGGRFCVFSLNDILHTIDRYKEEFVSQESEENE